MMAESLPQVTLPNGERVPAFGQGTWHMGEDRRGGAEEAAALKLGIELGMTLIDTAEMYGSGRAEEIVGEAAAGQRDKLFIISKVLPYNASRNGVSNFGLDDMQEWVALAGGEAVAANQILYNLQRRGPEWKLIPWCRERRIAIMAYTPLGQGRMLQHKALGEIASRHEATPAQVALVWLLRQDGMIVIPKASRQEHVRDNRGALDLRLTPDDIAAVDRAFPPPKGPTALGML